MAQKEIINMARDVNNVNQPDPNVLGVGQVYQFAVERYLKGNGPKTIYIVQPEGILTGDKVGLNLVDANILKARAQEKYIPIRLNIPFLLFLEPLNGFPDLKNYYVGSIQPWRFDISDLNQTIPESPWDGAIQTFPARPVAVLAEQVAHPEQVIPSNTPIPNNPSTPYP